MKQENQKNESLSEIVDVLSYMKTLRNPEVPKLCKDDITMSEWIDYWLTNFCGNLKVNTTVYYNSVAEQHIKRVLGHIILKEITSEEIQLFINSLSIGVGMEHALSPKSVKNIHGILHKCLDSAFQFGYIKCNPAKNIILPGIPHRHITVMSNEMLAEFLRRIKGHEKEILYITAVFTGMRESEIIGLTWDCIDFSDGSIHLYRQLVQDKNTKKFIFTSLKNNRKRVIYPSEYIMEILRKHREDCLKTEEGFVFVNKKSGTHYTIPSVYRTFKTIVGKMGYPDLRFHDLRHKFAVLSIQAGDDIKAIQSNLGHFSSAFTLDVYGHYTQEMQKISANKMTAYIKEEFPDVGSRVL